MNNDVVKNILYDQLVAKVNAYFLKVNTIDTKIPTSGLVSRTQFDSEKQYLEKIGSLLWAVK